MSLLLMLVILVSSRFQCSDTHKTPMQDHITGAPSVNIYSEEDCHDVVLKAFRGSIKSPGHPNGYPPDLDCNYKIELPKNNRIQLIFREVKLQPEDANSECCDYIEVYDCHVSWAKRIQDKFCGDGSGVVNEPIISSSNKLRIKFVSNKNLSNKGFMFTYDPYDPPKVTDMTQKVTGVVIGASCGLVFLILSVLAVCQSRRLNLICRRETPRYEMASMDVPDAVVQGGPPSYDDVMSSPDKYPPTTLNHEKRHRLLESRCVSERCESEDVPPRYSAVVHASEPGNDREEDLRDETRFQAISRSVSTDV